MNQPSTTLNTLWRLRKFLLRHWRPFEIQKNCRLKLFPLSQTLGAATKTFWCWNDPKTRCLLELVNHDYEDHYFLEIDRSTESLARIVNTCKKYIEYYRSGIEQRQKEVFPYVLWVVPDDKRKLAISKAIQKELYNFWELFTVITLEEYPDYIKGGIANESKE